MSIWIHHKERRWRVADDQPLDLSIPLQFDGPQPSFFGAPAAHASPFKTGSFSGEVSTGASCNCATYTITPHCNGTHTESVGHLLSAPLGVHSLARFPLVVGQLLTVPVVKAIDVAHEQDAVAQRQDGLITARELARFDYIDFTGVSALIVRTTPNPPTKREWKYNEANPAPYFTQAAMQWVVARGIRHLLVDVPSLDRADDGGRLQCHRLFWGLPERDRLPQSAQRPQATVTEMIYVDDAIDDGLYGLSLQIAPFASDAAPSRPLLYRLLQS